MSFDLESSERSEECSQPEVIILGVIHLEVESEAIILDEIMRENREEAPRPECLGVRGRSIQESGQRREKEDQDCGIMEAWIQRNRRDCFIM